MNNIEKVKEVFEYVIQKLPFKCFCGEQVNADNSAEAKEHLDHILPAKKSL